MDGTETAMRIYQNLRTIKLLARRLDVKEGKDDGYKFHDILDMSLFIGVADGLEGIELAEDYALMSVVITCPSITGPFDDDSDEENRRIKLAGFDYSGSF